MNKKYFLVLICWNLFIFLHRNELQQKIRDLLILQQEFIQGLVKNQVISWEDIPYAQPPVGNLRWRAPRPFEDQDRTILARDNNGCLQESSIYAGIQRVKG